MLLKANIYKLSDIAPLSEIYTLECPFKKIWTHHLKANYGISIPLAMRYKAILKNFQEFSYSGFHALKSEKKVTR
jgi:hypothetical protein